MNTQQVLRWQHGVRTGEFCGIICRVIRVQCVKAVCCTWLEISSNLQRTLNGEDVVVPIRRVLAEWFRMCLVCGLVTDHGNRPETLMSGACSCSSLKFSQCVPVKQCCDNILPLYCMCCKVFTCKLIKLVV